MKNLVSVCIPTYNGQLYIAETLRSISSQTYRNFEVIISDNLSGDDTLQIVKEWQKHQDFPVHIFSNNNIGIGNNWNFCMEKANGKYIKFIFQDDVMRNDCLQVMTEFFIAHKNIKFVACKRNFINSNANLTGAENWISKYGNLQSQFMHPDETYHIVTRKIFKNDYFFMSPTNKIGEPSAVMFDRNIIKKVGMFNTKYRQILDFEYWYRVLIYYDIAILDEELISFRLHDLQETNINRKNQVSEYQYYKHFVHEQLFWYVNNRYRISLLAERYIIFNYIRKFYGKIKKFTRLKIV